MGRRGLLWLEMDRGRKLYWIQRQFKGKDNIQNDRSNQNKPLFLAFNFVCASGISYHVLVFH